MYVVSLPLSCRYLYLFSPFQSISDLQIAHKPAQVLSAANSFDTTLQNIYTTSHPAGTGCTQISFSTKRTTALQIICFLKDCRNHTTSGTQT